MANANYDGNYVEFTCDECGWSIRRLMQDHDGFEVCRECRWYTERGLKPPGKVSVS